jgi:hypothetical protein
MALAFGYSRMCTPKGESGLTIKLQLTANEHEWIREGSTYFGASAKSDSNSVTYRGRWLIGLIYQIAHGDQSTSRLSRHDQRAELLWDFSGATLCAGFVVQAGFTLAMTAQVVPGVDSAGVSVIPLESDGVVAYGAG